MLDPVRVDHADLTVAEDPAEQGLLDVRHPRATEIDGDRARTEDPGRAAGDAVAHFDQRAPPAEQRTHEPEDRDRQAPRHHSEIRRPRQVVVPYEQRPHERHEQRESEGAREVNPMWTRSNCGPARVLASIRHATRGYAQRRAV